jgi:hypothetical protein
VLAHLNALDGAEMEITIEVYATREDGFAGDTVRIVGERHRPALPRPRLRVELTRHIAIRSRRRVERMIARSPDLPTIRHPLQQWRWEGRGR